MPTRASERTNGGLGTATKAVSERVSAIVRLEIELALSEIKRKAAALGVGIGLLAGAAVFSVFMVGFMFATIAAAFATFLPVWAALLIVTGILLLLVVVLGLLGATAVQKGAPPVPQQAIEEAKLTTEALKHGS